MTSEERLEVRIVSGNAEMNEALGVRRIVFIEEQRVPEDIEIDEYDDPGSDEVAHVLARLNGVAVATGRLLLEADAEGHCHIGRVAVLPELRGRGYGRAVMQALHDLARERGFRGVTLAAQLQAIGFYERLGYAARGGVFLDAGIEHRWMDIDLG
jgi:predicted GNAT family N-acyltransferase